MPGAVPLLTTVERADSLNEDGSKGAEAGPIGLIVPRRVLLRIPVERTDWLNEELPKGAELVPTWLSECGAVPLGTPVERAEWLSKLGSALVFVGSGKGGKPGNE